MSCILQVYFYGLLLFDSCHLKNHDVIVNNGSEGKKGLLSCFITAFISLRSEKTFDVIMDTGH